MKKINILLILIAVLSFLSCAKRKSVFYEYNSDVIVDSLLEQKALCRIDSLTRNLFSEDDSIVIDSTITKLVNDSICVIHRNVCLYKEKDDNGWRIYSGVVEYVLWTSASYNIEGKMEREYHESINTLSDIDSSHMSVLDTQKERRALINYLKGSHDNEIKDLVRQTVEGGDTSIVYWNTQYLKSNIIVIE